MLWYGGQQSQTQSHITNLAKNNTDIEELLIEDEEFLEELRTANPAVIDYFSRNK